MMTTMTIDDLKTGMIVLTRDGDSFIVMRNYLGGSDILAGLSDSNSVSGSWTILSKYNKNMTHPDYSDMDIMKVYDSQPYSADVLRFLIWNREEGNEESVGDRIVRLVDAERVRNYVKEQINPYGNDVDDPTYELGNKVMRYLDNMNVECRVDKWREYQQLEEQGKLLKLPCPLGTKVYTITWWDDVQEKVVVKGKTYYRTVHKHKVSKSTFCYQDIEDFGKTIFLTKKEAEAKLKEMERGNE